MFVTPIDSASLRVFRVVPSRPWDNLGQSIRGEGSAGVNEGAKRALCWEIGAVDRQGSGMTRGVSPCG